MKLLLFITLPLYLLDQVTKWLVLRFISTDEFVPVIPGVFYLVQVHNTGAAFGMLKDNNLFFMILASVALVLVAIFARRGAFADAPSRFGAETKVAVAGATAEIRGKGGGRGSRFTTLYAFRRQRRASLDLQRYFTDCFP